MTFIGFYNGLLDTILLYIRHPKFSIFDDLSPIVSTEDCFDAMLVPKDHVSRKPTDTYYLNTNTVLRTHTSAHEAPMLRNNIKSFLITGDVYRRDEIDASHYPVFHQVEGVRFFPEVSYFRNLLWF
jgi:phenylalanyl-tRNA synthetase alpha chain